ncbi:ribonuclease R [Geoalkalibacter subterraneus]|uniref:ribonuclease R n=1 Tax=Geoalkalibacter subterraneus TaxID=483547 RepID=UPI000694C746|nr:ribonuclease R [Geoalkalibacter subterraneus]
MKVTAQEVIDFFSGRARLPLTPAEIARQLDVPKGERKKLMALLDDLVAQSALVQLKGRRYALPRKVSLVTGTISIHRDGYGFVTPEAEEDEERRKDIFIPARFAREAMHGDQVLVRVERGARTGKPEGRIVRVVNRAHHTVVGRFEQSRKMAYLIPSDPRLTQDVFIPRAARGKAKTGQIVVARIDSFPSKNRNPEGTVIEVLGEAGDPEVEVMTIIHQHGLPHRFPASVLAAAQEIPDQVSPEEFGGREDLRELITMTIDGETAKDFDDAVSVRDEGGGRVRLWVSIADVGHYVKPGSEIDHEAYERGTSVYFPGRCIPMLPEKLSNGICSLNPDVERLAMTAEMLFDGSGNRIESRFYPSVIRSDARLTYTEVRAVLEENGSEVLKRHPGIEGPLAIMKVLARRLMDRRRKRGSIDFDLPEAEIILDLQGRIEDIVRSERHFAHRLIEEFMLAANEAVAGYLSERELPLLYRVHETPDLEKLKNFQEFVRHFGFDLSLRDEKVSPRDLQKVLDAVEGRPEERMINQVLLRCMKQARYAPENVGHFGLAADDYCHFTSPIRRYPDLVVHRILRDALAPGGLSEKKRGKLERNLPRIGEQTSARERRAMEAERDIVDLKKCQFMVQHTGDSFEGIISGVQAFGFFVELKEFFVEGLVHVSSLHDDFYHFEEEIHRLLGENHRRVYQIGSEVRVRVEHVDLERRQIDFVLDADATKDADAADDDKPSS